MKIIFFKQRLTSLILTCCIFLLTAIPVLAAEPPSITQRVQGGVKNLSTAAFGDVSFEGDTLVDPIVKIVNLTLTFTGVIFFLLLIYGGYLWAMARGNEEQIEKAKKIIREVIIGIIIIILARLIIEFIVFQIGESVPEIPQDGDPVPPIETDFIF